MQKTKLEIRQATTADIEGIAKLTAKVYEKLGGGYLVDKIRGQINNYPEGHFVVTLNGTIVGYSASIIVKEKKALAPHTWHEITGDGYGATHDPDGDVLYGYETCVDPDIRGQRIGQRIYNARKRLVRYLRLKSIIFGGRIPNFHKRKKQIADVKEYIELVKNKKLKDPTLGFQLRNGFEILGVLPKYLPVDIESEGNAVLLQWKNSEYDSRASGLNQPIKQNTVRVVSVQYQLRSINSFEEFENIVTYYVDVTSDYKADFVLFPELFTMQLLSIDNLQVSPSKAIRTMTDYTDRIKELFSKLAVKYNVNIIAGSHPTQVGDKVRNVSYVCLRDGSLHQQEKIHPTPDERYWWSIEGGDQVNAIETDCGLIGVAICYDSEFPELVRHLVNQGIRILFVPFLTDTRQGYCRVKYCCQARAVENQIYVATAGNVGNLPKVQNMDIQYAQSSIFTPCDYPFARDGIAADTTPNVEMVAIADLRMDVLLEARHNGSVKNLKDRRHDLYSVTWHKKNPS